MSLAGLPNIAPNFTTSQADANQINVRSGGAVDLGTYYGTTPTGPVLGAVLPSSSSLENNPMAWVIIGFLGLIGLGWAFKRREK